MRRISDVLGRGEEPEPRRYLKLSEVVDKELEIADYEQKEGDHGEYFIVQAKMAGKPIRFTCGAQYVMESLSRCAEEDGFPCLGLIRRHRGKSGYIYYTIE